LGVPLAFAAMAVTVRRLRGYVGFLGAVLMLGVLGASASVVFSGDTYYSSPRPSNWDVHPGGHGVVVVTFVAELILAAWFLILAIRRAEPFVVRHLCIAAAVASPVLMIVSIFAVAGN
jgi:hypothetical protein